MQYGLTNGNKLTWLSWSHMESAKRYFVLFFLVVSISSLHCWQTWTDLLGTAAMDDPLHLLFIFCSAFVIVIVTAHHIYKSHLGACVWGNQADREEETLAGFRQSPGLLSPCVTRCNAEHSVFEVERGHSWRACSCTGKRYGGRLVL